MNRRMPMLWIGVSMILAACGSSDPFEAAKQRVLTEVVAVEGRTDPVLVFALPEPLQPGDVIGAYQKAGYEPQPQSLTIEVPTWFFWIDDAPGAEFVHRNRFVFVEVESGEVTVNVEAWWPVLNGKGLWVTEAEYWNEENWIYPESPPAAALPASAGLKVLLRERAVKPFQTDSSGMAIVINGWEPGENGEQNFSADVELMADILNGDGFQTTYFGPENANMPGDVRTRSLNLDAVGEWFRTAGSQLSSGETLFVYIASHGWATEEGEGFLAGISERLLKVYLDNIDQGVNIVIMLQGCKSGAFIDGLMDVSDLTLTATNGTDPSYGDLDPGGVLDIPDLNPDDRGSEFTSGFVEDWQEIRADADQRAQAEARASRLMTNIWQETSALSFLSAVEKDASYHKGWSFPQATRGSAVTRPTALIDPVSDGFVCRNGAPLQIDTPAGIDIGSAEVVYNPTANTIDATIEVPRVAEMDGTLFGGMEFFDPEREPSAPNSNWYLDGKGNLNFSFTISLGGDVPLTRSYKYPIGWEDAAEMQFGLDVAGNQVKLSIPNDYIPVGAKFYLSLTDGLVCDEVGLDEFGLPGGWVPMTVDDPSLNLEGGGFLADELDAQYMLTPTVAGSNSASETLQLYYDPYGDAATCPGGEPVDDPVVDLGQLLIEFDPAASSDPVYMRLTLADPKATKENEYSFAFTVDLFREGNTVGSYIWQLHDGRREVGQVDPLTRQLISSGSQPVLRERMLDGEATGVLELEIERSQIPNLGFDQVLFQSFHMAQQSSQRTCDELLVLLTPRIIVDTADE
jgi:hypothetical protein